MSNSAATLVLLTPVGLDARCWANLALPDVPTLEHEFPGFGSRPRAAEQPTMRSLAAELARATTGPLDLVGVSMGAMVAQNLALAHPERVRSIVVACTGAAADHDAMQRRAHDVEAKGMPGVLAETLKRWFTAAALAARPEHPGVAYARRTLLALDAGAFADGWRAIATHDVRSRLTEIGVPTTCILGTLDPVGTRARVEEVATGVRDGRLVALEGPHMLHLEQPEAFADAIRNHLARVETMAAA